jgi:hypothetical protein
VRRGPGSSEGAACAGAAVGPWAPMLPRHAHPQQPGRWFSGLGVSDAPRRQVLVPCFDTSDVSQPCAKKSGSPRLLRP